MEACSNKIEVTVVCPERGMWPVLLKIKKWHVSDELGKHCIRHVQSEKQLAAGLNAARKFPGSAVLIPIGFTDSEVCCLLTSQDQQRMEVIVRPPRTGKRFGPEINEQPTASLFDQRRLINVQDTLPALRKTLLRMRLKNKVEIRELKSSDDFIQYFRLRYKVWNAMGYLSRQCDCENSEFELNYSDRTAYPIGAFNQKGELMGCARLVFPIGHDSHHLPLISQIVAAKNDAKLTANFQYPRMMLHPFDLLESLVGFRTYFAGLVRKHITYAEVSRVIVAPEFRKNGLGEVLVDSLVTLAQRYGVDLLFLACNDNLHSFYERCGFSVLPGLSCEHFAGVNAPAVAMAMNIEKNRCHSNKYSCDG